MQVRLFVLLLVFVNLLSAQTTVKSNNKLIQLKNAGSLRYDKKLHGGAQRLVGDVLLEHEGMTLNCDSAYWYDNNTVDAFGKIIIRHGDSLTVTGKSLHYDGNTKIADLTGDVVCVDKNIHMTTPQLSYHLKDRLALYNQGAKIINKENTLTSALGFYNEQNKTLTFKKDVVLRNPDYDMFGDTLHYNTITKTAYFLGPSAIKGKNNLIYCENGWYNTDKEEAAFSKNALITTKEQKLRGDSMYYNRNKGYAKVMKKFWLLDTTRKILMTGGFGEYYEKTESSLITKKPRVAKIQEKDTIFLWSDTIRSMEVDSHKIVKVFHNVRIYNKQIKARCDSVSYSTKDSLMELHKEPILWFDNNQLTAKFMRLNIGKTSVKYAELEHKCFAISKEDSLKFSQVKGNMMKAYFEGDTLRKIKVEGNSQAVYYMKNEKKKYVGVNQTLCEDMLVFLNEDGISKITFIAKPKSSIKPIKSTNPKDLYLKDFKWQIKRMPVMED